MPQESNLPAVPAQRPARVTNNVFVRRETNIAVVTRPVEISWGKLAFGGVSLLLLGFGLGRMSRR